MISVSPTSVVDSGGLLARDLSDLDIILDSTSRLNDPSLPNFGCKRVALIEDRLHT